MVFVSLSTLLVTSMQPHKLGYFSIIRLGYTVNLGV